MIKKFDIFINESYNEVVLESYYNSHGNYATFAEIRSLEVDERGNYTTEDFDNWKIKYNIEEEDEVLWVTKDKKIAYRYLFPAEFWDKLPDMSIEEIEEECEDNNDEIFEIDEKDGFIIPESNDGDEGYLFVKR